MVLKNPKHNEPHFVSRRESPQENKIITVGGKYGFKDITFYQWHKQLCEMHG